MKILTIEDVKTIIVKTGLNNLFHQAVEAMKTDFARWHDFDLSPRLAIHYEHGVIELMPCSDGELYSFKYVNGHPNNPAMGGDCPGKTDFNREILERSKVVVEYLPQSLIEGEMQQVPKTQAYAELWELVCNHKQGRVNDQEITLFDSVGFALEDFTMLRIFYNLAEKYQIGTELNLIPELDDPKNLYSLLRFF